MAFGWATGSAALAGRVLLVGAHLLAACFFAFALYGILRAIFVKQASGDAIFGAVCGYLLLGIIWSLVVLRRGDGFPGVLSTCQRRGAPMPRLRDRTAAFSSYYSFITLATVGYGDVTPTTPLARTLAWMEAITGQFYLAVLVAGLVGFKVTQAMKD